MITVEIETRFRHRRRAKNEVLACQTNDVCVQSGRVPRVACLMALAIRFDQLNRDGIVAEQAALDRLGHVSRERLTQIMNLLSLAPNIQDALLFLPKTTKGRDAVTERELRPILAFADWNVQRPEWKNLVGGQCRSQQRS